MSLLQLLALQVPQLQPSSNIPWAFLIQTDSACLNANEEMRKAECGTVWLWEPQHSHTGPSRQRHPPGGSILQWNSWLTTSTEHHPTMVKTSGTTLWPSYTAAHAEAEVYRKSTCMDSCPLFDSHHPLGHKLDVTQTLNCWEQPILTRESLKKNKMNQRSTHTASVLMGTLATPPDRDWSTQGTPTAETAPPSSYTQRIRDTHLKKSRFMFWPEKKDCLNEG